MNLDNNLTEAVSQPIQRPYDWAIDAAGAIVAHSEYTQSSGDWSLVKGRSGGPAIVTIRQPLGEVGLQGLGRTPGTVVINKAEPEEWTLADGTHVPPAR